MWKAAWMVLIALALPMAPAAALEPGDLVIGVGADLYVLDPVTGEPELLAAGPSPGTVVDVVAGVQGDLFFAFWGVESAASGIWRLEPQTGERRRVSPIVSSPMAIDLDGSLFVAVSGGPVLGGATEVLRIESETGEVTSIAEMGGSVSDIAIDRDGHVLLSFAFFVPKIVRLDPETGETELVSSTGGDEIAVDADGSILVGMTHLFPRRPLPGESPVPPQAPHGTVVRIDPQTGEVDPVTESPILVQIESLAVEASGDVIVRRAPPFIVIGPGPRLTPSVLRAASNDGSLELLAELPSTSARGLAVVPPLVEIEVRPSRAVGARRPRMLPVVVVGSDTVDVEQIDIESLALGPGGAAPVWSRVVRRIRGGYLDLLLHFRADEAGFARGEVGPCLTGWIGPFAFRACDDWSARGRLEPQHARGRGRPQPP